VRFTVRVLTYCSIFALCAAGYALLLDGFDGFAFSRSPSTSWTAWLVGLVAVGTVSIAFEITTDWLFEPDHWYSPGPRRSTRLAWAAIIIVVSALVIWVGRRLMVL